MLIDHFPKNKQPYPAQVKAINQIEDAIKEGHKFIIVQAPTGSGKSYIAKTLGNWAPDPDPTFTTLVQRNRHIMGNADEVEQMLSFPSHGAYTLTTTKQLQSQYVDEFVDMRLLKGKGNYQCAVDEEMTVDTAPCLHAPSILSNCLKNGICPYYNAERDTILSKFATLNYTKYICASEVVQKRKILVCDECSEIENTLVGHYTCTVIYKTLEYFGIDIEKKLMSDKSEPARIWLSELMVKVENVLISLKEEGEIFRKKNIKKIRSITDFLGTLKQTVSHWGECEFIIEYSKDQVVFTPFKVNTLAQYMFMNADIVVLMSATIPDYKNFAKILGIEEYKYIECDSVFKPEKSPIFLSKSYPLSYRLMDTNLPKVFEMVKKIVDAHKGQKGIIHTHTFQITEKLKEYLGYDHRLLFRGDGFTNESIIQEHIERGDDTILISPSLTMGVDLKGDLGMWQIIIKMPYSPLGNKRIKKMADADQDWYTAQMLKDFIQACGRCTRSIDDSSRTYVLDGNSYSTIQRNHHLLPKYFIDRLK